MRKTKDFEINVEGKGSHSLEVLVRRAQAVVDALRGYVFEETGKKNGFHYEKGIIQRHLEDYSEMLGTLKFLEELPEQVLFESTAELGLQRIFAADQGELRVKYESGLDRREADWGDAVVELIGMMRAFIDDFQRHAAELIADLEKINPRKKSSVRSVAGELDSLLKSYEFGHIAAIRPTHRKSTPEAIRKTVDEVHAAIAKTDRVFESLGLDIENEKGGRHWNTQLISQSTRIGFVRQGGELLKSVLQQGVDADGLKRINDFFNFVEFKLLEGDIQAFSTRTGLFLT